MIQILTITSLHIVLLKYELTKYKICDPILLNM